MLLASLLNAGVSLTVATLAALAGGFLLAGLLGVVLLRLRGHYFAIASLSLVGVLRELVNNATDLTGGGMGLIYPWRPVPAFWPTPPSSFTRCGDCCWRPR